MSADSVFFIILIISTFLCSLVAGLVFAFTVIVMPGIKKLNDKEFIRSFQVMDGIIQNNQPVFMLVWIGSAIALIITTLLGFGQLDTIGRFLITTAAVIYLLGVYLPTIMINIPLNNRLQAVDVDAVDEITQKKARDEFEPRWIRWNTNRTYISGIVTLLLMILLYLL